MGLMKKLSFPLGLTLVSILVYGGVAAAAARADDRVAIAALEQRFLKAFQAKDIASIMAMYVPDETLVVFDVIPPRQYVGWQAYKKDWEEFLALFDGPITVELNDLHVTTAGTLGYGHSIQHVAGRTRDGKLLDLTVRVTDVYRKIKGKWLITHEHVSVPVDLATGKADFSSKP